MAIGFGRRIGYGRKVMDQAPSRSYLKILSRPRMVSDSVRDRIIERIGEAPRDGYA